jgi:hypothetical protein
MIIEPHFLIKAREMAEKPLRYRFNSVNLFLALFLESFASKLLIWLLASGDYPYIHPIPLPKEDKEELHQRIRDAFDPQLADAVLFVRPASDEPHYTDWLTRHAPDGVSPVDFRTFLSLCDIAITRWNDRYKIETQTILGAKVFAFSAAWSVRLLVIYSFFLRGFQSIEMGLAIIAMLVAGMVCKNKLSVT